MARNGERRHETSVMSRVDLSRSLANFSKHMYSDGYIALQISRRHSTPSYRTSYRGEKAAREVSSRLFPYFVTIQNANVLSFIDMTSHEVSIQALPLQQD